MTEILDDDVNLQLLEDLVSGIAVSVNISSLSRHLDKHRNTVKKKVESLFKNGIIDPPAFPFWSLYKVYPLLAATNIQMPDDDLNYERFEKWVKEDPQIFAAYRVVESEFDTLLFTYHENITKFQLWMLSIPSILRIDYDVTEKYSNFLSSTSYFSNQLMLKYNPSIGINLMENDYEKNGKLIIRNIALDKLDLEIIRCLTFGKGIKIEISALCDKTNLHRKTIEKRISLFLKEGIITNPVCRFPNFFVPPNYLLTYMLVELKNMNESFVKDILMDYRIPVTIHTIHGKYNLLMFCNHKNIEDQLRWEEHYKRKHRDSFLSVSKTYLSPEMTISFSHQIVALCYIRKKLHKEVTDLRARIQALKRAQVRVLYDLPD